MKALGPFSIGKLRQLRPLSAKALVQERRDRRQASDCSSPGAKQLGFSPESQELFNAGAIKVSLNLPAALQDRFFAALE